MLSLIQARNQGERKFRIIVAQNFDRSELWKAFKHYDGFLKDQ